MCSNRATLLARISQAIDEVATAASADDMAGFAERLTVIWALLAEADPALAERLPGYTGSAG